MKKIMFYVLLGVLSIPALIMLGYIVYMIITWTLFDYSFPLEKILFLPMLLTINIGCILLVAISTEDLTLW